MLKLSSEQENKLAEALEWSWLLAIGGALVLVGFVLLLLEFQPEPLGREAMRPAPTASTPNSR